MTAIWLVRHGEAAATWGEHEDPGLSELGKQQAEAAAELLIEEIPDDIQLISSPKARAIETAAPLSARLAAGVRVVDAFREIQAPVALSERQEWLKGFMREEWHRQPESLWGWRNNIISGLSALNRPAVIFTHFLVINAVVAHIRQHPATVQLWPDNASHHQFVNGPHGLEIVALGRELTTRIN